MIVCFPFVFTQWLNVLSYFIMLIAPVGAVIAAEHFLLPRLGIHPFWREQQGRDTNLPAFAAWGLGIVVGIVLLMLEAIHLFALFISVWLVGFLSYPLLCRLAGAARGNDASDPYEAAYGPVLERSPTETPPAGYQPVNRRSPWYAIAVACLDTFQSLIVLPTLLYFIAATAWMKGRRRPRPRDDERPVSLASDVD